MIDMTDYMNWMIIGGILMVLEVLTPGVFFLWIGIASFITGIIAFIVPSASVELLGTLFAILAVICALAGKKLMYDKPQPESTLNNRLEQYKGQVYQVYEPIVDGRGKITIGDTVWTAIAKEKIAANTPVKVVGVKGTYLEVEPVHEEQ